MLFFFSSFCIFRDRSAIDVKRDAVQYDDSTSSIFSPLAGHHNGVRFIVLPAVSHQMESRNFRNVRPMQGARTGEMLDGSIRAAGIAPTSMDEEDIKLFGRTVERVRHAPRGIYQQTWRSASEQVRRKRGEKKRKREMHI